MTAFASVVRLKAGYSIASLFCHTRPMQLINIVRGGTTTWRETAGNMLLQYSPFFADVHVAKWILTSPLKVAHSRHPIGDKLKIAKHYRAQK